MRRLLVKKAVNSSRATVFQRLGQRPGFSARFFDAERVECVEQTIMLYAPDSSTMLLL
jgi:hypothetical protein